MALPALFDLCDALFPKARNFAEAVDIVVENFDSILTETLDNGLGRSLADAPDTARAEVALDTLDADRHHLAPGLDGELHAVLGVVAIAAFEFEAYPRGNFAHDAGGDKGLVARV